MLESLFNKVAGLSYCDGTARILFTLTSKSSRILFSFYLCFNLSWLEKKILYLVEKFSQRAHSLFCV